jgi:heme-degrading monooxygenase HmoA
MAMILRMWRARATISRAGDYIRHATTVVFPKIRAIEGHRGDYLLRPEEEEGVELVVLTLWESMEAVRRFAGPDPDKAVVEPGAQAGLTSFDDYVTHFEVVDSMADSQIPEAEFQREAPEKRPAV